MNKIEIGQKLITLRGDESREKVSTEIGVSISALQMYENGQRIPKDEIKVRLANYYNTTVQDIFFEHKPHEMCG
ncbi:helix-turn-helix transcriptional regulator [Domibacillus aminovorans]|uniref:XRE family transcriptional regulator n=1 Tax=Domibacillus aminovorans TaxID=29332 RepID=A0A177L453_9BACI|nr:helix-turn-helix transcriptional regulator [Domibacillus aminovorans]OAH60107.1 XRE family transcriptional regulator [Domibacillus aminovorans]